MLAKIAKLENVNTYSITSNEVISINSTYDIFNSKIKDVKLNKFMIYNEYSEDYKDFKTFKKIVAHYSELGYCMIGIW